MDGTIITVTGRELYPDTSHIHELEHRLAQLAEDVERLSSSLTAPSSAFVEWRDATAQFRRALRSAVDAIKAASDAAVQAAALAATGARDAAQMSAAAAIAAAETSAAEVGAVSAAAAAAEAAALRFERISERVAVDAASPDRLSRSAAKAPQLVDERRRLALLGALRDVAGSEEFTNVLDDPEFA